MPALCATPDSSLPCSAATDDASSKRLSWGKIVQKLTDFSNHSLHSDDEHFRSVFSHSGSDSVDSVSLSESDFLYDPVEETLCSEVVDLIEQSLTEAKDSALRCSKLLIPDQLMEHIGQELLHLAASEPCGLRGALINLCVEQSDTCQSIEQIAVDPDLVPTFQLTLVLRLESGGLWPMIQDLFAPRSHSAPILRHALRLNTGFRVIKKEVVQFRRTCHRGMLTPKVTMGVTSRSLCD